MKHSLAFKFLVVLLTALSVTALIGCGLGIVALEDANLYADDLSKLQDTQYDRIAKSLAQSCADFYAVETYSNIPYLLKQEMYDDPQQRGDADHWSVTIAENGTPVSTLGSVNGGVAFTKTFTIDSRYPIVDIEEEETDTDSDQPDSSPTDYLYRETKTIWENGGLSSYTLYYYEAPEYTVTVSVQPDVLTSSELQLLTVLFPYRYALIIVLAVCLILFFAGLAYLCWSAGRAADGTIHPGGLNRLPLDIYAVILGILTAILFFPFRGLTLWIKNEGPHAGNITMGGSMIMGFCLLGLALILAFAAQVKVPDGFVWRHTLIGRILLLLWAAVRFLALGTVRLTRLLPIVWQWLLTAVLLAAGTAVLIFLTRNHGGIYTVLLVADIVACAGFLCYCGYAIGSLIHGVRRMCNGDLHCKISTDYLHGSFKSLALHLNALSETAMISAENQTRSERMKSELITNISHDIKTPLTSIINFVDLLQKSPSAQASEEYLQVLSRQSSRMKKLIEDLMELSRANSGNITAHITTLDAAESVNQALGEFSDKFASADIEPVFQIPQIPIKMQADGRLVWRVLSNLMSNAVKYAMPGTRLYIELAEIEGNVHLSLKNVSREAPKISAEDLIERFVRGDASRHSEGSGLGLNIAKSLMELQQGQLQLMLDGDLFKVTLVFPKAE